MATIRTIARATVKASSAWARSRRSRSAAQAKQVLPACSPCRWHRILHLPGDTESAIADLFRQHRIGPIAAVVGIRGGDAERHLLRRNDSPGRLDAGTDLCGGDREAPVEHHRLAVPRVIIE